MAPEVDSWIPEVQRGLTGTNDWKRPRKQPETQSSLWMTSCLPDRAVDVGIMFQIPIGNYEVKLGDKKIFDLPVKFHRLFQEIEKSKYIINLVDDTYEDDVQQYDEKTWLNAIKFVCDYTISIYNFSKKVIPPPQILHGPEGGIDVLWKSKRYRLLINIPYFENQLASFYGDNYNRNTVKGTFEISNINTGVLMSILSIF